MSDVSRAVQAVVARILEGDGKASRARRRAAFDDAEGSGPLPALIHKVARHAYEVTDGDIDAVRAAGVSEDEIFEVVVCAAIGQAKGQYDAALSALAAATTGKG